MLLQHVKMRASSVFRATNDNQVVESYFFDENNHGIRNCSNAGARELRVLIMTFGADKKFTTRR